MTFPPWLSWNFPFTVMVPLEKLSVRAVTATVVVAETVALLPKVIVPVPPPPPIVCVTPPLRRMPPPPEVIEMLPVLALMMSPVQVTLAVLVPL